MSAPATLPELTEADAPPEIAAVYRELRTLSGAPMVALIWRHLATYPGVLTAAWSALQPLFVAGRLQQAAWRAADATVTIPAAGLQREHLAALDLDPAAQLAFVRVLDAYNRVNPVNFVAVRILREVLAGRTGGLTPPPQDWTPSSTIGALPPMVAISTLSPEHRAAIDALATGPIVDRRRVVPSLYRHLTAWPRLIPAIRADLAPRIASGEIPQAVAAVAAALHREALELAAYVPPVPALAGDAGVADTLESFSALIPEMVVVGTVLRRAIAD